MEYKKEKQPQCSYLQAFHIKLLVLVPLVSQVEAYSLFSLQLQCRLSVYCLVCQALTLTWWVKGSALFVFLFQEYELFSFPRALIEGKCLQDIYNKAEKLLSSSLSDWGSTLATSDTIDPVWAQVLTDPFLRRLILRYYSIKLNGDYYRNIFPFLVL